MPKGAVLSRAVTAYLFFSLLCSCASHSSDISYSQQVSGSANSQRGMVKSIFILRKNGGRVDWSPEGDWIAIDRKGVDGYYDVYLIRPNGSAERCLTCDTGGAIGARNNGQPAFHPAGRYLVFQSQKKPDVGNWGRDIASTPGFGKHSDLWIMDMRQNSFYQLTRTPNSNDTAVLHAHFSKDGKQLSWCELYEDGNAFKPGKLIGYWQLKVADFSITANGPQLTNIRELQPGGPAFYENHGFSPDGSKLIFTSNFQSTKMFELDANDIYIADTRGGKPKLLAKEGYNEVAHFTPRGKHILWMTSRNNKNRGTDYWIMNPDGSNKRRVTDFNNPDHPQFKGKRIISADNSFSPDGKRFAAYLQTNLISQVGMTIIVELDLNETEPL